MTPRNHSKGFTLIETLVVLAIFIVVLGALVSSIRFFYRSNTHALEQSFAINSARIGIERMVKDTREASFSDEGSYPVISMATSSFSFYSDVDEDIFVEKVRYFLDGTNLNRGVVDSTGDPLAYDDNSEVVSLVSDNVRNNTESVVLFTYYNASGTEMVSLTDVTDVRFVTAEVVVNVNPARLPNNFSLRSSATLRNVKESQ
ncbi:type II secretion system protein [Candidatus Kaiserbacteria bacterium]|nr:type II secretion system protein [Candidatus Kaiserbacteria bacterium]